MVSKGSQTLSSSIRVARSIADKENDIASMEDSEEKRDIELELKDLYLEQIKLSKAGIKIHRENAGRLKDLLKKQG